MQQELQETRIWQPTKRQTDFLSLPDSIFEALYGGAAGGGKSEGLLMLPIVRQFHEHPRFKGLLLRRTFPELEREIILRAPEFYSPLGGKYNETKHRWQFPSGAIMQFGHIENEKDVRSYDSTQYNYIGWDELTTFTRSQYEYVSFTRCRSSDNRLPSIVRAGTNPGGIGHSWVFNRFVKPYEGGYKIIRRNVTFENKVLKVDAIFIPSKATDNPHLIEANPNYMAIMSMLPESERIAKRDGRWDTFEGQVFNDWDYEKHVVKFNESKVPSYWARVLSIDWGFRAMMCAGFYAINPVPNEKIPFKIVKYREHTCEKTKISTWATDLRRISSNEELMDVVIDPSARQDRGLESTIEQEFALYFGRSARLARNDRVSGKTLLQEYLRVDPRPARYVPKEGFDLDLSLRIRRLYGEKSQEEYKNLFLPEEQEGYLPKLVFDESCEHTIDILPKCVYAANTKGKANEDVAEFPGDDPYDETRYGLDACQQYLDEGKNYHEKEYKIAEIVQQLERTKDLTSFYIKMDKLDHDNKEVVKFKRRRR